MTDKTTSKSVEKRVKTQKEEAIGTLTARIVELEGKVVTLEAQKKAVIECFEFAANESRPVYGLGAMAVIFDAVAKRLGK